MAEHERVPVKVLWVLPEEGGRDAPPGALEYSTVAWFEEDGERWREGAWSIVLEFDEPPLNHDTISRGWAHFLVPSAPHERLRAGRMFDLYEGARKVAVVNILEL